MCDEPWRLPDDIPFERWVDHVFDHPVLDPKWWWRGDEHYEEWNEETDPARTLRYVTRLFEAPAFLAERFSRGQIDQGFNYLICNSCSNHMFALMDESLPWEDRRRGIRAIVPVFRDLFAKVYKDDACLYNSGERNYACFMWWDITPLYATEGPMLDEILSVLRQTLQIRSDACVESALHGLGEFHSASNGRSSAIIKDFLKECRVSGRRLSPKLVKYANAAATGDIQ